VKIEVAGPDDLFLCRALFLLGRFLLSSPRFSSRFRRVSFPYVTKRDFPFYGCADPLFLAFCPCFSHTLARPSVGILPPRVVEEMESAFP